MSFIKTFNINELGYGNSFIHKLHPLNKLILLIINYIILFNMKYSIVYITFIIIIMLLTCITIKTLCKLLLFLTVPLLGFGILLLFVKTQNPIQLVIYIYFKMLSMVIPLMFYSLTTSLRETSYTVYKIFYPLEKVGINTNLITLISSLIISYIPILLREFNNVLLIKASKGENIKEVNILKKIKIIYKSLFVVLISSFLKAENLVDAIIIRGFHKNEKRIFYLNYKFYKKDKIFLTITLVIFITLLAI